MIKFIKNLFNRKTKLQQQNELCLMLDQLQSKTLEGMKLV